MKIYKNVRGTMRNVPTVEVGKDTVYIRSDIARVEETEFSGWEYNEIQMAKDKYLEKIQQENNLLNKKVELLASENEAKDDLLQEIILQMHQ